MRKDLRLREQKLAKREVKLIELEEKVAELEGGYESKLSRLMTLFKWTSRKIEDFRSDFPEFAQRIIFDTSQISREMEAYVDMERSVEDLMMSRKELLALREELLERRRLYARENTKKLGDIKKKILEQERLLALAINSFMNDGEEKRTDVRITIDVPVTLNSEHKLLRGNLENISRSGIFVSTTDLLPVNRELEINFNIEGRQAAIVQGKVIWVRQGEGDNQSGMGIAFTEISTDTLELLASKLKFFYA